MSVPLPLDWPDTGAVGGFDAHGDTLRDVARRLRDLAEASHPGLPDSGWNDCGAVGAVPPLEEQTGMWATGRAMQHLHAQLREGVTAFHGALVAGLPAVAAKLELSAATYDSGDRAGARRIEVAANGQAAGPSPSMVGPDGRF